MPLRIFISHSHKDNDWCDAFLAELGNYDVDVWYDRQGLFAGVQWVQKIQEELASRDVFLLILSQDAWDSKWVQEELGLALAEGKRIIPVLHKTTAVTGFMKTRQMIDGVGQNAIDVAKVVARELHLRTKISIERNAIMAALTERHRQGVTEQDPINISGGWLSPKDLLLRELHLVFKQSSSSLDGEGALWDIHGCQLARYSIKGTIQERKVSLILFLVDDLTKQYLVSAEIQDNDTMYTKGMEKILAILRGSPRLLPLRRAWPGT